VWLEALGLERVGDVVEDRRLIFDDEDARFHAASVGKGGVAIKGGVVGGEINLPSS
jgi:hypothetical protein